MDVSSLIAASSSKSRSTEVVKEVPLQVDAGLLAVFDSNEVNEEEYRADTEAYLQATARDGVQALINGLFDLPIQKSGDGPLAMLPAIETAFPRAKPLPKPKPPTKWEQFAAAKGIQKTRREKKVWDEEKQEWVNRWGGRGAKNKEVEEKWAVEVPANAPNDYDPFKEARDERKARVTKNEKQQLANVARAQGTSAAALKEEKRAQLNRQIAQTRTSTASMGRFDRKLDGEPKIRGVKRKFDPNERSADEERKASLAIAARLERDGPSAKKSRRESTGGGDDVLNVRKAIRHASGGKGALALAQGNRKTGGKKGRGQAPPKGKSRRR